MKGGRTELHLPNDPRVNAILERYLTVERLELLGEQTHDFVWVSRHGGPLSYKGIETMVKIRTKTQFGISFGSHRFRHSLITTPALIDGTDSLGPARVLGHSVQTALKSYNRADNLAATRRYDVQISAAEDAATAIRGREQGRAGKPEPVTLLDRWRR